MYSKDQSMIESFSGKNRSFPYGMVLSALLVKKVENLGTTRRVYLSQAQHINAFLGIRMGFKIQDGVWVRGNKKRKADQETDIPSSFAQSSQTIKDVILRLADLKSEFFAFYEKVCGEF